MRITLVLNFPLTVSETFQRDLAVTLAGGGHPGGGAESGGAGRRPPPPVKPP